MVAVAVARHGGAAGQEAAALAAGDAAPGVRGAGDGARRRGAAPGGVPRDRRRSAGLTHGAWLHRAVPLRRADRLLPARRLPRVIYTSIAVPMALCCAIYSFLYCTYPKDREVARAEAARDRGGHGGEGSDTEDEEGDGERKLLPQ